MSKKNLELAANLAMNAGRSKMTCAAGSMFKLVMVDGKNENL